MSRADHHSDGAAPQPMPLALPWEALFAACERAYPEEACGFVASAEDGRRSMRVVAIPNAFGGTARARVRFELEPGALLAALSELEGRRERLAAFFHSHVDGRARWSSEDDRAARESDGGPPLWPDAEQLVVAVEDGRATEVARFRWALVDAGADRGWRLREVSRVPRERG